MTLQTREIETAPNPDFAVIWMHGLGADSSDFVPVVPELGLPAGAAVRFVFPDAPVIPVTANAGYRMRAWFDILAFGGSPRVDEAGIRAAMTAIRELVAREQGRGIGSRRIVLAGFSQGAAMAYLVGLTHPESLAGIIALSGFMPAPQLVAAAGQHRALPVFAAHGSQDDAVSLQRGEEARDFARARGHDVEWHSYAMPHAVCMEEIAAIGHWLALRLAA